MTRSSHADTLWNQVLSAARTVAAPAVAELQSLDTMAVCCELAAAIAILLPDEPPQRTPRYPDRAAAPIADLKRARWLAVSLSAEFGTLVPTVQVPDETLLSDHEHVPVLFGPMNGLGAGFVYAAAVHRGRVRAELEATLAFHEECAIPVDAPAGATTPDLEATYAIQAWEMHMIPVLQVLDLLDNVRGGAGELYALPLRDLLMRLANGSRQNPH